MVSIYCIIMSDNSSSIVRTVSDDKLMEPFQTEKVGDPLLTACLDSYEKLEKLQAEYDRLLLTNEGLNESMCIYADITYKYHEMVENLNTECLRLTEENRQLRGENLFNSKVTEAPDDDVTDGE